MLYYFKKGKNTTEMQIDICAVYGEGAANDRTCQKWFVKFHAGDFSLDDAPQSGGPFDSDQIKTLIENNQHYTIHTQNIQINKVIGESKTCVLFYGKKHQNILANPINVDYSCKCTIKQLQKSK